MRKQGDYIIIIIVIIFSVLGLELRAYTLSLSISLFFVLSILDRISQTICLDWL
jgi:hypothetical protein